MTRTVLLVTAGVLVTAAGLFGQAPVSTDPAFEVASIKVNKSADPRIVIQPPQGGRFTATNIPLRLLIRNAYQLQDFQIDGGPNWMSSDRFDVVAKAVDNAPPDQIRLMLRGLLADRFKLRTHTETRELPIYVLMMARSDGRTGPQLRRTEADCARAVPPSLDPGVGLSPRNGPPPCGFFGFAPSTDIPSGRGGLAFRGLTMAALAKLLAPMVRRSVSDQTALTGYFDAEFDFVAELPPPPPPPGVPDPYDRQSFPTIFTAVQEQLGLKLDPRRGPVEVLVIDHVEPPSAD